MTKATKLKKPRFQSVVSDATESAGTIGSDFLAAQYLTP